MSIFDVLREVDELIRRERRVSVTLIQQRFALRDHDLSTIVDELTGPSGNAMLYDGELVAREPARPVAAQVETLRPGETEHRDLTVLFCDLVGSTALSAQLDAEDFSDAIHRYYDTVTAVFEGHDGHVANLMGDGLLVLWGYPRAQDDSPRQACAAALAALAAIEASGLGLEIRIGMHVGPVAVSNIGPGGRTGALALGETVNVAARVQSAAEPGGAYISDDLAKLIRGWFELAPVGERLFKGLAVPMEISRVVRRSGARNALEARLERGLSPLAGRADVLAAVGAAWERARRGEGQLVALIGEPGIGKSRMLEEVRRRIDAAGVQWFAGQCSPYSTATTLHPFAEVPELGEISHATPPPGLSAEGRRKWTLRALHDRIVDGGAGPPLALIVEDLHWADPTSMELIDLVRSSLRTAPVLVLLTSREPLPAHWEGEGVHSVLLTPLDPDTGADFVTKLARGATLPAATVAAVVERAGGNPLYLEELTNMLLAAEGDVHGESIPPALQSPLLARLDALGDAKVIAQVASVIGVHFSTTSLHSVLGADHRDGLPYALARMVETGLVFNDDRDGDRYAFRHALIHHAAYQSLLKRSRREIHGRLLDLWRPGAEAVGEPAVEVVARHAAAAGRHAEAAELFTLAGRRAADRSAHKESSQHFTRALESLGEIDGDTTRRRLDVQRAHASTLVALLGYTHPETVATWRQTHDLAVELDDLHEITSSLLGLAVSRYGSADLAGATELIDEAMAGAQATGDVAQMIVANAERTSVAYFGGDYSAAVRYGDEAIEQYDALTHHHRVVELVGDDSGVAAMSMSAWGLMQVGRLDEAIERGRAAIKLAQSTGHPFSVGQAGLWNQLMLLELGDVDIAEVDALIEFCDEQDFRLWGGAARVVAAAVLGDPELHVVGSDLAASTSSLVMVSAISGIHSDTLRLAGDLTGALRAADDGLRFSEAVRIPFWDSQLLLRRGELLAAGAGGPAAATESENVLRQSLEVADRQHAVWSALVTATRLAERLAASDRADEARALLAPRLGAVVGGSNLSTVITAKALLASLHNQEVDTTT